MKILEKLQASASALQASVVFPEGNDSRTLQAVTWLSERGIVRPVVIGKPEMVWQMASEAGIELPAGLRVIEPATFERLDEFAKAFYELRKHKGISRAEAREQVQEPLRFAAMLVRTGEVDGCVAGAVNATGDVLRAGFQIIGLAEGIEVVSSTFLMVLPDGRALTYGDCGVVPYPDAKQLAQIAVASARTHTQLTGETPIVAMLSFSTKGSARHDCVSKVQDATALVRQMAPDLLVDGELQFDAAYVEHVGKRKAPDSAVAGRANVFIFPNLDAGNIAYKITERLGGAQAIGPIIQGLAKPLHDLSRGCKAEDIVTLSAICAIQAK